MSKTIRITKRDVQIAVGLKELKAIAEADIRGCSHRSRLPPSARTFELYEDIVKNVEIHRDAQDEQPE